MHNKNTPAKRKQLSKKLRFEVFKRDGFVCQYCGSVPPNALLQVDHIAPVALGGENHIDNLITSCQPCNIGKGATSLSSIPQSMKEKTKEIQERESQIIAYNSIIIWHRHRIDSDCWRLANIYLAAIGEHENSIDHRMLNSIRMFISRAGLHECLDAMDISINRWAAFNKNKVFKYFCGVMWRKIKEAEL